MPAAAHAAVHRQAPRRPRPDAVHRRGAGVPVRPPAAGRPGAAGRRARTRRRKPSNWSARTSAWTSRCPSSSSRFVSRRAARRLRQVAAHQATGRHRDRRALHADVLAHRRPACPGRWSFGMAIGVALGRLAQPLARPRRHDAGGLRHLVPVVRAGHGADAGLLGPARLAAHRRRRQLAALHPAVADAGRGGGGGHGALHALVVRRDPAGGLHPHRARQGPARERASSSSTACATR